MNILKKHIPIALAFTMGIIGIALFFSPTQTSEYWRTEFSQWGRIIAGFAIIVGIYSLLNHHYHKLKRKVPGWGFSVIVYFGLVAMVVCGFSFRMVVPEREEFGTWSVGKQRMLLTMNGAIFVDTDAERQRINDELAVDGDLPRAVIDTTEGYLDGLTIVTRVPIMWLYEFVFVPMQATMFAMLAFFIASAAYRAFRARTLEASVLLITAIIMMLGRVPIGEMMWSRFPELTDWILNTPSMAVMRGIIMGVGLGMIATALRIIFGIERTYMGGGGD